MRRYIKKITLDLFQNPFFMKSGKDVRFEYDRNYIPFIGYITYYVLGL